MQDETIIRLFPNLRRGWSPSGVQAKVPVSGRNGQQVLSCALNVKSGEAITSVHARMNSAGFCALLGMIRAHYVRRPVWILLDSGSLHTSAITTQTAAQVNIKLIMLPKQCPELNVVDHLWRSVKADVSANYQYSTVTEHADAALNYVLQMTPQDRLCRAGILAPNFWLNNRL